MRIAEFQNKCQQKRCCHKKVGYTGRRRIRCKDFDLKQCAERFWRYCDWDCNEKRVKERKKQKKSKSKAKKKKKKSNDYHFQSRVFKEFDPANGVFKNYFTDDKNKDIFFSNDMNVNFAKLSTKELQKRSSILERGECGEVYEYKYEDKKDLQNIFFDSKKTKISNSRNFKPNSKNKPGMDDVDDNDDNGIGKRRRMPVHAPDDRKQIKSKRYPWRTNGYILFDSRNNTYGCTGTLIGSDIVLTAGHCVHEGNGGGWFFNFRFYPNVVSIDDVDDSNMYTDWSAATFAKWARDGDIGYDFGWIVLNEYPGTQLGWLGFGYDDGLEPDTYFNTVGYPGDKQPITKWKQYCAHNVIDQYTMLSTTCDSSYGQSGAPTYLYWSRTRTRIIYGVLHGGNAFYNVYPKMTASKYHTLCDYTHNCDD